MKQRAREREQHTRSIEHRGLIRLALVTRTLDARSLLLFVAHARTLPSIHSVFAVFAMIHQLSRSSHGIARSEEGEGGGRDDTVRMNAQRAQELLARNRHRFARATMLVHEREQSSTRPSAAQATEIRASAVAIAEDCSKIMQSLARVCTRGT